MGVLSTTPGTAVANTTLTAAFWNTEVRDALTNLQSAWTSYTPVLTAATTNPTLGTGSTQTGAYHQWGKTIVANGRVGFGSSGAVAGSGRYAISLPVTPTGGLSMGIGIYTDSSGPTTMAFLPRQSGSTFFLYLDNQTAATFGIGSAAPVIPNVNDTFDFLVVYQAA